MKIKFIAFLFLVFLTGCASQAEFSRSANTATSARKEDSSGGSKKSDVTAQVSLDQADKSAAETVPTERKIIRNADLQLEADAPEDAQQKITAIAESKGGFVVKSTQSSSNSKATIHDSVTMIIRVPSGKFDESLEEIRKLSGRVISESVKGDDVTEEFVDVEARLKAKKAVEAQFLEIMKQAKTVEDALNVQTKLGDVRSEIEQIEGRMRFLQNQTSLSTINISLQTSANFSPNSSGFFYQLSQAFSSGFNFALNFILGLITLVVAILPFFIFIVLPCFLIIRYFWKRNKKTILAKQIVKEEIKTE